MTKFKQGDYVQSHYRGQWYGIVLNVGPTVEYKNRKSYLLRVKMLKDRCGHPIRKGKIVQYNESWFTLIKSGVIGDFGKFQDGTEL